MKRVIITGASDGLGRQFGLKCIENGVEVIALCRTMPDYECDFIKTDLTSENSMIESCNIIKEKYNEFDALINCAGVPGIQRIDNITYDCLENLMKINSIAPMFLTSQLINLIKINEADIVNVGSTIGLKQGYES